MASVTCTAPVNIACVKYWGKRHEKLILPIHASLSTTLDQQQLCAKTTVSAHSDFTCDRMWLNGEEQSLESPRLQNVLREIRRRARKRKSSKEEDSVGDLHLSWHVHICSENNFPTAAGLASSAAGYACLVFALAKLFKVEGDISEIARQGSGSACRSVYGGFVEWSVGTENDGSDSIARQIEPETHWPEMRILLLVVSGKKKPIGSTAGMQNTVKTSQLMAKRRETVPKTMQLMEQAIKERNFENFAELTMKDSNQMHAVCLDTYPPISYMMDTSRDIVRIVHAVNDYYSKNKVAYTFDAGPNACLYVLESMVPVIIGLVQHFFPPLKEDQNFVRGLASAEAQLPQALINSIPLQVSPGALQYVIHTKVGPGPQVLDSSHSLLGNDGLPKTSS